MVQCKNCKYAIINEGKRHCLRFPPNVMCKNPAATGYESVYPVVEDNYRCGEGATK